MKKVIVPLAPGVEEMEAVIIIDTFRRANWQVSSAGTKDGEIVASRGVKLIPDTTIDKIKPEEFDMIVLPGGAAGTENLRKNETVLNIIKKFYEENKIVAAICAGPLVLQEAGILKGKRITCHPAVKDKIIEAQRVEDRVVIDGNIITSQGPGTTFDFALTIISIIEGKDHVKSLAEGMIVEENFC